MRQAVEPRLDSRVVVVQAVAFGMDAKKDAVLHRNTIRSDKLEKMAKK
jgi:hypothetical protein